MAIDNTRQLIQQITNASSVGENTATRVGNAMEAMLNDVKAADDKANAATNRINTTEQGIANANQRLTTEEGINAAQNAQIEGLKQDLQNIRPVIVEGDVTNNPDNVFLTSENDEITPKERTTSSSAFGHYIMRSGEFAAKLKANYIHEIPFNIDLSGATVTIPSGAVLKFTGGSISNGTIIWDDTLLSGEVKMSGITIGGGRLINKEVFVDWFGTDGTGSVDDSAAILAAVASVGKNGCSLIFGEGKTYLHGDGLSGNDGTGNQYTYVEYETGKYSPDSSAIANYNTQHGTSIQPSNVDFGRDIRLYFDSFDNLTIDGRGSKIISNDANGIVYNNSILWLYRCTNSVVKDLILDGRKAQRFANLGVQYTDYNSGHGYVEWHNLRVVGCNNITFDGVTSNNSCHNGFDIKYDYESGESNYSISFINCNADNAYKNGIGCNDCHGLVVDGGVYSNCGSGYGILPKANMDFEPESTHIIEDIVISGVRSTWDLSADLSVYGGVVINAGSQSTNVSGCSFENSGLEIIGATQTKEAAKSVSVKGCSFKNSILWNQGKSAVVESSTFTYDSEYTTYNGSSVTHKYTTPIITGTQTRFIGNIVNWSSNLSAFSGYLSLSGIVNNNEFNDLCGSGNYIFRSEAAELSNNTFTDAGVAGYSGKVFGASLPESGGQNQFGDGIELYSGSVGLMMGNDYVSGSKKHITRALLLSATQVAIFLPKPSDYGVTKIKIGIREKVNNVSVYTYIEYDSLAQTIGSSGFRTLENGATNISFKINATNGYLIDLSNVTFVGSRYIFFAAEYDYMYPYQKNTTPYTILDATGLSDLTTNISFSGILLCRTSGTTAERPPTNRIKAGFQYYDTSLSPNKYIMWNGSAWVNLDGTSL